MKNPLLPYILTLALLPFILFWPLTLVRETFYVHDVQNYFYPYHAVSANILRSGELPLWNPYAFSGIPLLGDGQTAMFYPPNWLFFLLPAAAALNYAILLQFSIAGVGMFLCALGFGLRRTPALFAAIAFMFCGMITARVVHLSIMSGVALIPWLVWCVDQVLGVRGQGSGAGTSERGVGSDSNYRSIRHRKSQPLALDSWFVAAAVVAALQVFAGHPQVPVYTAGALVLLALLRGIEAWRVTGRWLALVGAGVRLAGIYTLGYTLAAIQLVPWVELGAASPRAAGAAFEFVMGSGTHGAEWLLFLFPYLAGAQRTGAFARAPLGIAQAVNTWEHSAYVGVPTLGLALLGVGWFVWLTVNRAGSSAKGAPDAKERAAERRRWFTLLFLIVLVVGAALVGAGKYTPVAYLVYQLPVVGKLRAVERVLSLVAFGLPLLAGFGLQWLLEGRGFSRFRGLVAVCAGGAVVLVTLGWIWFAGQLGAAPLLGIVPNDLPRLALRYTNAWLPLALAAGSALLLGWWAFRPTGRLTVALLLALLLVDMAAYTLTFNPTTAATLYDYKPQSLAALDGGGQPFRKATVLLNRNDWPNQIAQETLAVSWSMAYGIEDTNGFNSLQPRRYTDYLFGTGQSDVSYGFLPNQALLQADNPVLPSLNVRYILVPVAGPQPQLGPQYKLVSENAQARIYENLQTWPRAFFSEQVRAESDPLAILHTVTAPGFDARREAWIESATAPALPMPSGTATVTVSRQSANQLTLRTQTSQPRFLVTSEMYFPGWQATIDGAAVPIERTNYLFRGLVVPTGEHTVQFSYRPASALIGLAVSVLAALVSAGLVARAASRHPNSVTQ